ncbi:uncharacterized protein BDR25DRAFT_358626 [Lindgomyces ingoldianus]|uniref:Uncharacterized protein n=1 Tax=Lindgomyces ingoldianus TaxID=673940 RepID=A0ACB6QLW5_9PLEO|nr:uncharacterized protein BDR25DRAFT_358626 [Lindgomyces ingoldianus]KAF2467515.1 hypothetical protein BDR25DRAFT_358626 [Lindgomyces ingoldianus]
MWMLMDYCDDSHWEGLGKSRRKKKLPRTYPIPSRTEAKISALPLFNRHRPNTRTQPIILELENLRQCLECNKRAGEELVHIGVEMNWIGWRRNWEWERCGKGARKEEGGWVAADIDYRTWLYCIKSPQLHCRISIFLFYLDFAMTSCMLLIIWITLWYQPLKYAQIPLLTPRNIPRPSGNQASTKTIT